MNSAVTVYAARFMRPRLAKCVITRATLIHKLHEALNYPLTIVRAGAGYGKSTLINQAFPEPFVKTVWLHLSDQENATIPFLLHLVHAVRRTIPNFTMNSISMLVWDERQGNADPFLVMETFIHDLREGVHEKIIIILDDYQFISAGNEVLKLTDIMIECLPENIHLVIASREKVCLPGLVLKRANGQVLDISEEDLIFGCQDIQELFKDFYGVTIDETIASKMAKRTEGWVMGIHMLGQNMKKGRSWETALASLPQSFSELFDFLASNYLSKQPEAIRRFLLSTAYLHILKVDDCNHIMGIDASAAILSDLENKGLFTVHISDGLYRYHQLFQEFLKKNGALSPQERRDINYKAASYYRLVDPTLAVEHFLAGHFYNEAALLIKDVYQQKLAYGQQADLESWLGKLPQELVGGIPELLLCRGDIYRLTGNFAKALKLYHLAEKGFAINGNDVSGYLMAKAFALVYLDTVQPVLAEQFLVRALAFVEQKDIAEKARLYQLMAENSTNLGQAEQAATFFAQANEFFLEDSRGDVEARMHLRTGRLVTAKQILLRQSERHLSFQVPKSHRETPLLLSLINTFMGDIDEAWFNAQQGLNMGIQLKALFVQAVGYMRLGHAKQLKSWMNRDEAAECYQQAIELVSQLDVERGKAEPLFGLCLLYGYQGNLDSAVRYGHEGVRVGEKSKDIWMTAMTELALTIAYYKSGVFDEADRWGCRAHATFVVCGDSYLSTIALFWQTRVAMEGQDVAAFRQLADKLLHASQSHEFDFIFYKSTLLGIRDNQEAMPLLLAAQQQNIRSEYVGSLLTELGVSAELTSHPGYTLRVQTLGPFVTWRGMIEVKPKEWQREKAKRLFQYFLAYRKKLVHKERLIEDLWGEDGTDSDFKVAMHAMVNALEPARHARKTAFYITKNESIYGLNLAAGISIDVDEFESYITRGRRIETKDPEQAIRLFRLALNLYKGDFLQECCYLDWCQNERERLLILYLKTAERMAIMLLDRGETEECISLCTRILGKDRCWEMAYSLLMQSYHSQNNRVMVVKVFKQCQESLQGELGVSPTPEMITLFKKLANLTVNI